MLSPDPREVFTMIEGNCNVCNRKAASLHRARDGSICNNCKDSLPQSIKSNLQDYKISELAKVIGKFKKINEILEPGPKIFGTRSVSLYDTGIEFSGVFLAYNNIKSVKLNCYPVEIDARRRIKALITFVI